MHHAPENYSVSRVRRLHRRHGVLIMGTYASVAGQFLKQSPPPDNSGERAFSIEIHKKWRAAQDIIQHSLPADSFSAPRMSPAPRKSGIRRHSPNARRSWNRQSSPRD